jgi:hypothetical protein
MGGNDDDFKHGRNFQIVEPNGATSEATSIYDARNSLFSAYRTLFRQWRLVFGIMQATGRTGMHLVHLRRFGGTGGNIRPLRYRIRWRINVHHFISSKSPGILSRDESRRKTGPPCRSQAGGCRA